MPDPTQPSAPPSRTALAAALVQAAESEPFLADRSVVQIGWGVQRIDMASGWVWLIWWKPDAELGPLSAARAPDGAEWTYGCDRWPDWNAGPDAVVLDPLRHLITAEQRERLRARLLDATCWPAPEPPPPPPPLTPEELERLFPLEEMAS